MHLELRNVTKTYPGVAALSDVSFSIDYGETLGLVGENGAGKSTLLDILCGLQQPNAGSLSLHGETVVFDTPRQATLSGVSRVHQEQSLILVYPVYQNLFLGLEEHFTRFGIVQFKKMQTEATRILAGLGIRLDAAAITGDLNFGTRQLIEIARVVAQSEILKIDHPLVLLDEPTASLSGSELELFYHIVARLKSTYRASIVFISHRLEEVLKLSDRVLVLKDGRVVDDHVREPTEAKLHGLMVGRARLTDFYATDRQRTTFGAPVLTLSHFSSDQFEDVSLTVREGEILGIGGLVQSGKTELGRAILGVERARGGVTIFGENVIASSPSDRIQRGVGYVPLHRHLDGVMLGRSIRDNIVLPSLDEFTRNGVVAYGKADAFVAERMTELRVKAPSANTLVGALSGGNQQKVVLAKWLARNPRLLIIDNPTRGVDAGAKEEIYRLLRDVADKGCAILLISDDLVELIEMSNTIHFLSSGRISSPVPAPADHKPKEQDVIAMMF
ncbi:sugar ABC transporter ATP-binding protein [Rhizobium sp. DKSPLA3]|uniref:Sugar ABC transporter ATP-binding protein n=1 Tax=Rhizobium quercicola TaxID=2901226 RepID=A0A9X1NQ96_9HYPH|nr:sugar ABC transporter ATP-binding protein [Rhizobium quercicola]MCD7107421.1 sugar ABC transporter ATP-binding protein [Rhizobium quercicola]